LGYIFDQDAAERQEAWFCTEAGRESLRLQKELILRLVRPRRGERLLDVGCGSGLHLEIFKREGLDVTGVDPSRSMLDLAHARLGHQAGLFPGQAEDLPFEDNDFDIVTMITCLEFIDDPETALAEALRVARSRVFVGVLNRLSLTALGRRVRGLFKDSMYNHARFFSLWELTALIRGLIGPTSFRWATVQVLPPGLALHASSFEERPLVQVNPFGAFLGLTADVAYTMHADGLILKSGLKLGRKRVPTPSPSTYGPPHMKSGRSWANLPERREVQK